MNQAENTQGTILIVDDIPNNLKLLLNYLTKLGFKVLVGQDGEDGLAKALYAKPDVILLDIMMPRMDGFETCRQLKANPETRDIPVIFMSALSDLADKMKGFQMGAVDYITKPIQHEEVLARVTTHLTLRTLQRTLAQRNTELNMLTHTMLRDLQVPLLTVGLFSQVLRKECTQITPDIERYFNNVRQAYQKMNNNMEAVLLLLNMRASEVCLQPIDMGKVFQKVYARIIHLQSDFIPTVALPDAWPQIYCNPIWAEDIWAGILNYFLASGDLPITLRIIAQVEEDGLGYFYLHDDTLTLPPEQTQALFHHPKEHPQNALGLSVIQRMIMRCGGKIGMDSSLFSTGRTLYFALPTSS